MVNAAIQSVGSCTSGVGPSGRSPQSPSNQRIHTSHTTTAEPATAQWLPEALGSDEITLSVELITRIGGAIPTMTAGQRSRAPNHGQKRDASPGDLRTPCTSSTLVPSARANPYVSQNSATTDGRALACLAAASCTFEGSDLLRDNARVKILSLNVWGGLGGDALLDFLASSDADVFCLQEVTRAQTSSSPWLSYRDGCVEFKQRADLYGELQMALPHHDGFFCPVSRGELFDGGTPHRQEFGLATFVRSSIAVTGMALDFVHGTYAPNGFGTHPRPRNAHGVRLFDYVADRPMTVVQMHGLRETSGKGDTPARDAQTDALVRLIERVWPASEPLVVCGDFNVLPGSGLFDALATLGLTDLVTTRGFTDTRTSLYTKPGRFADYMLTSPQLVVASFDIISQPEVSDHRPLLLTTQ